MANKNAAYGNAFWSFSWYGNSVLKSCLVKTRSSPVLKACDWKPMCSPPEGWAGEIAVPRPSLWGHPPLMSHNKPRDAHRLGISLLNAHPPGSPQGKLLRLDANTDIVLVSTQMQLLERVMWKDSWSPAIMFLHIKKKKEKSKCV